MNTWLLVGLILIGILIGGSLLFYYFLKMLPKMIQTGLKVFVALIGAVIAILGVVGTAGTAGLGSLGTIPIILIGLSVIVLAVFGENIFKTFIKSVGGLIK